MADCMMPLFVNTTDISGGAGRAAYRLFKGIRNSGIDARMLVWEKISQDPHIATPKKNMKSLVERIKPHMERLPFRLYPNRLNRPFHFQWNPGVSPSVLRRMRPDLVHLHWICGGFLKIESLPRLHRPVVWTLHDMWAFTGGCNYSLDCHGYENACGCCPILNSSNKHDLSHWVWRRKKRSWADMSLAIVSPSRWLADCAGKSSLFSDRTIEVIPNGIDTQAYRPYDKRLARDRFKLPHNRPLVLFSAANGINNIYKGFDHLRLALHKVRDLLSGSMAELVIVGKASSRDIEGIDLPVHSMGHLAGDQDLAYLYSAADLFAAPSIQDNLPNTVMEALACGTPCLAFRIGGLPDMIEHQENGYLAEPFDAEDLARGIAWLLGDEGRHRKLSARAREKVVSEFAIEAIAAKYVRLYSAITDNNYQEEGWKR